MRPNDPTVDHGRIWTGRSTTSAHVSHMILDADLLPVRGTVSTSSWSVNQYVRRALAPCSSHAVEAVCWTWCSYNVAEVGPPRPRSCGHVATKTLNQRVFKRHATVRHERAVPASGSFPFWRRLLAQARAHLALKRVSTCFTALKRVSTMRRQGKPR